MKNFRFKKQKVTPNSGIYVKGVELTQSCISSKNLIKIIKTPDQKVLRLGFGLVWFGLVLWHINHCRLIIENSFYTKTSSISNNSI